MTLSTLSSNGQTTIPMEIRKMLGIEPSDKILYRVENGRVFLEGMGANTEDLYGSLSPNPNASPAKSEAEARRDYAARKYGAVKGKRG